MSMEQWWNDTDVSSEHSVLTAYVPAPHEHSQHNQANTTRSLKKKLVFLTMGITMPETCRESSNHE